MNCLTQIEHLFQTLDAGVVLPVGIPRAPVVGNPVDEPVDLPGTNERLALSVDFAQACRDLEVARETGCAFWAPVTVGRKDREWDERPRHWTRALKSLSSASTFSKRTWCWPVFRASGGETEIRDRAI